MTVYYLYLCAWHGRHAFPTARDRDEEGTLGRGLYTKDIA